MIKYTCSMAAVGEIYYATLIADDEQQAKDMAVDEANKRWRGSGGRSRNWTTAVLERDVPGPARVIDCGRREA